MEEREALLKRIATALIVCGKGEWNESTLTSFQNWLYFCVFQAEESELKQCLAAAQRQYRERPRCLYFCSNASGCLSRYETQNGFPMASDESISVVATECLAECKNGPVGIICWDSAEVMIADFGAQDSVDQIRDFLIQAFQGTDVPLDQIPFRRRSDCNRNLAPKAT
jgi:hypothetical protein